MLLPGAGLPASRWADYRLDPVLRNALAMPLLNTDISGFRLLAERRGHRWEDVLPCITRMDVAPGICEVDTDHEAYPHRCCEPMPGVGTALKGILERFGIKASPTCSCTKKARYMDEMGVEWCEENIELIVKWIGDEARKRRLPYFKAVGRMLVTRAIRVAKNAKL